MIRSRAVRGRERPRRFSFAMRCGPTAAPPRPLTGSPLQPLLLMQSPVVTDRVVAAKDSRVQRLLDAYKDDNVKVVDEMFLATLCRPPSAEEKQVSLAALAKDRTEGAQNLQWALINQVEFFFNY